MVLMMSRIPKYFTSEDFDAPVILGDAWGYLNNVFRKCLVEGYNQRLDLASYTIIDNKNVRFTFATAHNYRQYQVLKISGIGNDELHDECMVESVTDLTITCSYYKELYTPIDTNTGSLTGKSIVAPLGMREKWRDGDRSVYVVDQEVEECFLTVDARTPANWTDLATGTSYPAVITPVVYMTDGMSDIDTVTGSKIVPYDELYQTRYNSEWLGGTSNNLPHKGIGFFQSYYTSGSNTAANTIAQATIKGKWKIIGNGRFFYLITESTIYADKLNVYFFGKFKSDRNSLNYALYYGSLLSTYNPYVVNSLYTPLEYVTNSISNSKNIYSYSGRDSELLSDINNIGKTKFNISVGYSQVENSGATGNSISGHSSLRKYDHNGRMQLTDYTVYENGNIVGLLPSVKFMGNRVNFMHGVVYKLKSNNFDVKYVYIYQSSGTNNTTSTATYTYLFSLDYQDWKNYD